MGRNAEHCKELRRAGMSLADFALVQRGKLPSKMAFYSTRQKFVLDGAAHQRNVIALPNIGAIDVRDGNAGGVAMNPLDGVACEQR